MGTTVLQQQINSEKRKEECLMKAIKEKEIENQYNIAKSQAEHAIQKITKETQTQIASRLTTINRAGDSKKCTSALTDGNEREKYCSQNFADNYIKYSDCINKDSFCYVCCENEFGDLHVVQRDACYT